MYEDTVFTILVDLEMYRDTIFVIETNPDMYLYRYLCLPVLSCVMCFFGCTRASLSLVSVGDPDTSVSHEVLSQIHCRKCSM